jgi:lipopolysaccharide transport system permease protein
MADTAPPAAEAEPALPALPARPLVRIRPSRGGVSLNLTDLWAYRELLFFLAWRDIKVRYKQTFFGVLWAVAQPVLTAVIFALFFGQFMGVPSDGVPYGAFALAGLLPWTFFAASVLSGSTSVVASANLITKVYFPRLIIPLAAVLAKLVDFAIAGVVLVALLVWYETPVTWLLLLVPVLVLLLAALGVGVSAAMSALNVKYRDFGHILPFAVQLGMFATPVIYPLSVVPERFRWVAALNPLTGILESFRAALFGLPIDWPLLAGSAALTLAVLLAGTVVFRRMERTFADTI